MEATNKNNFTKYSYIKMNVMNYVTILFCEFCYSLGTLEKIWYFLIQLVTDFSHVYIPFTMSCVLACVLSS